jgi:hypothetical protein
MMEIFALIEIVRGIANLVPMPPNLILHRTGGCSLVFSLPKNRGKK